MIRFMFILFLAICFLFSLVGFHFTSGTWYDETTVTSDWNGSKPEDEPMLGQAPFDLDPVLLDKEHAKQAEEDYVGALEVCQSDGWYGVIDQATHEFKHKSSDQEEAYKECLYYLLYWLSQKGRRDEENKVNQRGEFLRGEEALKENLRYRIESGIRPTRNDNFGVALQESEVIDIASDSRGYDSIPYRKPQKSCVLNYFKKETVMRCTWF
ncbi:hypothetical protein OCU04_008481 [Sclerotinia nivalis]|uniref:Uncharacterized protein n=1 Tax=Sclerotinia nivalis TaxID=352851 RepID=A0A9X0AID9_9HELO|nr:hypothetical protein OCU04_008481 [Sclerotinia nivalis]